MRLLACPGLSATLQIRQTRFRHETSSPASEMSHVEALRYLESAAKRA